MIRRLIINSRIVLAHNKRQYISGVQYIYMHREKFFTADESRRYTLECVRARSYNKRFKTCFFSYLSILKSRAESEYPTMAAAASRSREKRNFGRDLTSINRESFFSLYTLSYPKKFIEPAHTHTHTRAVSG